jgi:hypothetical protein
VGRERIRWFNQVLGGIWKNRKVGNKIKNSVKNRKIGSVLNFNLYKMKEIPTK